MIGRIPDSWIQCTIGGLNQFSSHTIDPAKFPNEIFELFSIPSFPSGKPEHLKGADIGSTKQIVVANDVLISKINPRINRVWQVSVPKKFRQIASSEWIVFRNDILNARFYRHYFTSYAFREMICSDLTGVGGSLTRAQPKKVATFPLPIAPLNEQNRIADKLDKLLEQVDVCHDRLDRLPTILKRFRQSVLTSATSGRLTEKWRKKNKASEWQQIDIQSVAQVGTGSTPLRSNPTFYAPTGTPWITSAATSQSTVVSSNEFVTQAAITKHRLKTYPIGTLLIAMYGEGKTRGQVTELGIPATINQACAAIVVNEKIALKKFVKLALQAKYYEMRELAEGGNQPNLNLTKIKEFPLLLPSLLEQTEIVQQVESLFVFAERLETNYMNARNQLEKLTPSLLAKAFRGELVSQETSDESAESLLARISEQYSNKTKPTIKIS